MATNPAQPTVPDGNALYAKNIPKAWCNFSVSGGVRTIHDAFNINSVILLGGPPADLSFAFHTAMANTNYAVVAFGSTPCTAVQNQLIENRAGRLVSAFVLSLYDPAGVQQDITAVDVAGSVVVFGEQTT